MRLTEWTISTVLLKEKTICIAFILTSMFSESRQSEIPWDKWSRYIQEPIGVEHSYRRHEYIPNPIKAPTFQCECPPNKECVLNFKINKDMVEFLDMKGILKETELKNIRADLEKMEHTAGVYEQNKDKFEGIRNRRSSLNLEEKNCCCPPKTVYMPSFITEHKFIELVDKIKKDKTNNKLLNNTENKGCCSKPPVVIQPVIIKLFRYPHKKNGTSIIDQLKNLEIGGFFG
ncbi:hypothetical protein PYW08_000327 [Mythimna loreyi]|uniref:Uncharacterized protein n=1 Tax=Mythimna loreyi TaxID=667449 RepID=A0ACC2RC52_9NEOP|nr:hypothetical protein PYW08_000327 [Mythimna loreyi]